MRKFLFHFAALVVLFPAVLTLSSCGRTLVEPATAVGLGGSGSISPKTTPEIAWPQPPAITHPTPLSATQLNATASVPGAFVYTPPAGTVLAAGTQTLSVAFTPTDTTDYNTASASVSLTVNPAPIVKTTPTIAWTQPTAITNPTPLSASQLDATGERSRNIRLHAIRRNRPGSGNPDPLRNLHPHGHDRLHHCNCVGDVYGESRTGDHNLARHRRHGKWQSTDLQHPAYYR